MARGVTTPSGPSDLAALIAFAVAHQQSAAVPVEVGLVERERFADPQPGAPEHYDHAAQPVTVGAITGGTHHRDDLLNGRRIRRIPNPFVARRNTTVKGRRSRWGAAAPSAIRQRDGLHDVLLWTVVDTAIIHGRADPATATPKGEPDRGTSGSHDLGLARSPARSNVSERRAGAAWAPREPTTQHAGRDRSPSRGRPGPGAFTRKGSPAAVQLLGGLPRHHLGAEVRGRNTCAALLAAHRGLSCSTSGDLHSKFAGLRVARNVSGSQRPAFVN